MNEELERETAGLVRAWAQHQAEWLGRYLVSGVEDPRINGQSILTRHSLMDRLWPSRWEGVKREEHRFAAVLRWWLSLELGDDDLETKSAIRHALMHGADNAEGIALPPFVRAAHRELPRSMEGVMIPNYVENLLDTAGGPDEVRSRRERTWGTMGEVWRTILRDCTPGPAGHPSERPGAGDETDPSLGMRVKPRVLEPACGSGNDYRGLSGYGLAAFLDYTGVDLCDANIVNARREFPEVRFERGNVFELEHDDGEFDGLFVHDLFEHLSPAGLSAGVAEVCRVTRSWMIVHFFSMHEGEEPIVRPVGDYHCNTLSLARTRALFESHRFAGNVFHLDTFMRWLLGLGGYHNPNAYSLLLERLPE